MVPTQKLKIFYFRMIKRSFFLNLIKSFFVVYHLTSVAIENGLLKNFWPFMVKGYVLRTGGVPLFVTMLTRLLR